MMESAFGKEEFKWGEEAPKEQGGPFDPGEFVNNYRKKAEDGSQAGEEVAGIFVRAAKRIVRKFLEFAKQAVEIAVSKFLVELCAMIIAGISTALMTKHSRGVDISTPGVFYNRNGTSQPSPPPASNSNQSSLWGPSGSSPFDSGWSRGNPAW